MISKIYERKNELKLKYVNILIKIIIIDLGT